MSAPARARQRGAPEANQMTDDITALRANCSSSSAQHDSGALAAEAFAAGKARSSAKSSTPCWPSRGTGRAGSRPSQAPRGVARRGRLVVAGAGYWWTGSPGLASAGASAPRRQRRPTHSNPTTTRKFAAAVEQLAERLKDQPDNAEGWAMLARSYGLLGQLEPALPAFQKAVALRGRRCASAGRLRRHAGGQERPQPRGRADQAGRARAEDRARPT